MTATPEQIYAARWEEIELLFPNLDDAVELFVWTPPFEDGHKRTLTCIECRGKYYVVCRDVNEVVLQLWEVML